MPGLPWHDETRDSVVSLFLPGMVARTDSLDRPLAGVAAIPKTPDDGAVRAKLKKPELRTSTDFWPWGTLVGGDFPLG